MSKSKAKPCKVGVEPSNTGERCHPVCELKHLKIVPLFDKFKKGGASGVAASLDAIETVIGDGKQAHLRYRWQAAKKKKGKDKGKEEKAHFVPLPNKPVLPDPTFWEVVYAAIPRLREQFGIRAAPANRRYGGWWVDDYRRIDFYKGGKGEADSDADERNKGHVPKHPKNDPNVTQLMAEHLKPHAQLMQEQLSALDDTRWGVDPALTLTVAYRESSGVSFRPGPAVSTYDVGGLDDLYAEQSQLRLREPAPFLPASFPLLKAAPERYNEKQESKLIPKLYVLDCAAHNAPLCGRCWQRGMFCDTHRAEMNGWRDLPHATITAKSKSFCPWEKKFLKDLGRKQQPALLSGKQAIILYGARVNLAKWDFVRMAFRAAQLVYGQKGGTIVDQARLDELAEEINALPIAAWRTWTVIAFGGAGVACKLLQDCMRNRIPLQKIYGQEAVARHGKKLPHHLMRGVVNAAEAQLLEELVPALPAPAQWKIGIKCALCPDKRKGGSAAAADEQAVLG